MVGNAVTVCLSPDWSLKERLLWYLVGGRDLIIIIIITDFYGQTHRALHSHYIQIHALYCIQCIALPCFVQCS